MRRCSTSIWAGCRRIATRDALAPLREVDTIAHVIRVFDDPSVPHAAGRIDPLRDATNLELELILSDHDQITRRLERVEKDLKKKADKALEAEKAVLEKCKAHLEAEKPLRELELTAEERKPIGGFLFLSQRPMLYVLNVGDDEAEELSTGGGAAQVECAAGASRIRRWWRFAGGSKRNWRRWKRRKRRSCWRRMG